MPRRGGDGIPPESYDKKVTQPVCVHLAGRRAWLHRQHPTGFEAGAEVGREDASGGGQGPVLGGSGDKEQSALLVAVAGVSTTGMRAFLRFFRLWVMRECAL